MIHVRSVSKILILNEKNELLLLRIGVHTQQPERSHTIDLPGGFVDPGESERAGALREIKEETNIDIVPNDLKLMYSFTKFYEHKPSSIVHLMYMVKLDYTPEIAVSWEHESYEWVDFDTILDRDDLRPNFREGIAYVQENSLLEQASFSA